jgi:ribonuclease HII
MQLRGGDSGGVALHHIVPNFSYEKRLGGVVAGVDEVGRGPLAGPVVAAAVILPAGLPAELAEMIDDSKKMTAARRVLALAGMRAAGAEIGLAGASVAEIQRLNILHASMLAMRRAVGRLPRVPDHVLVDGNRVPGCGVACTALVGGDGISLSIAAASIAAKVLRDELMCRLGARYPEYGWGRNAGYGAAVHRAAILAHGATPHHRMGFGALLRQIAMEAEVLETVG